MWEPPPGRVHRAPDAVLRPRGAGLAAGGRHVRPSVPAGPLGHPLPPPPGDTRRSPRRSPSLSGTAKRPRLGALWSERAAGKRGLARSSSRTPRAPRTSPALRLGARRGHRPPQTPFFRDRGRRRDPPCTLGTFSVSTGQLLRPRRQHMYHVSKPGGREGALCPP